MRVFQGPLDRSLDSKIKTRFYAGRALQLETGSTNVDHETQLRHEQSWAWRFLCSLSTEYFVSDATVIATLYLASASLLVDVPGGIFFLYLEQAA